MHSKNVTPLYGHTSEKTAYLVPDYPYGRKVRCRIRYWIESDPKKGHRLVSQTENPRTLAWNAPKRSTYTIASACLYLDDVGHVQWASFSTWSAVDALSYVRCFPGAAGIEEARRFVRLKITHLTNMLSGKRWFEINGVHQEYTEVDRARDSVELAVWIDVLEEGKVAA